MNWQRVMALVGRHTLLIKRNTARLLDVFFWPIMEVIMWGFMSLYLVRTDAHIPSFVAFFLGALILWETLMRSSLGISVSYLEELWTKNFINLFASPLTPGEFIAGTVVSSFLRVVVSSAIIVAFSTVAYGFNIFHLGLPLAFFFANLLIMGWSLGIVVVALIMRFGQAAEMLAWAFAALFQPVSAVFYPVSILPPFVRTIALFVPSSHVFEGMRQVITSGTVSGHDMLWAVALNIVYFIGAVGIFFASYRSAKRSGRLARTWQ